MMYEQEASSSPVCTQGVAQGLIILIYLDNLPSLSWWLVHILHFFSLIYGARDPFIFTGNPPHRGRKYKHLTKDLREKKKTEARDNIMLSDYIWIFFIQFPIVFQT